jgi:2-polyprenyl-3-methyl-5-hydroxy-6-metoxy-1,4-benzoquinol methylase
MDNDHLRLLRETEIKKVSYVIKKKYPCPARILELGAGAGWQAKYLADQGYLVTAIDICASDYVNLQIWPVINYDGKRIPFEDKAFDIVFSSNVLEHIEHIDVYEKEILRVLKDNGRAIHVLPSFSWRYWTAVMHYPGVAKKIFKKLKQHESSDQNSPAKPRNTQTVEANRNTLSKTFLNNLFPHRHGERGTIITELYLFSKTAWHQHFSNNAWIVEDVLESDLFYTGYSIFGSLISIDFRKYLSRILGSSCNIYILKKNTCSP